MGDGRTPSTSGRAALLGIGALRRGRRAGLERWLYRAVGVGWVPYRAVPWCRGGTVHGCTPAPRYPVRAWWWCRAVRGSTVVVHRHHSTPSVRGVCALPCRGVGRGHCAAPGLVFLRRDAPGPRSDGGQGRAGARMRRPLNVSAWPNPTHHPYPPSERGLVYQPRAPAPVCLTSCPPYPRSTLQAPPPPISSPIRYLPLRYAPRGVHFALKFSSSGGGSATMMWVEIQALLPLL